MNSGLEGRWKGNVIEIYGTVVWHIDLLLEIDAAGIIKGTGSLTCPDDEDDSCSVHLEGRYEPNIERFLIKMAMDDDSYAWLLILVLDDKQKPPQLSGKGCLTEDVRAIRSFPFLLDAVRASGELPGDVENRDADTVQFVDPGRFEMRYAGPE